MSIIFNYNKFNECYSDLNDAISFLKRAQNNVWEGNRLLSKNNIYLDGNIKQINKIEKMFKEFKTDYEETNQKMSLAVMGNNVPFKDELRGFSLGLTDASVSNQDILNLEMGPLNRNIENDYQNIVLHRQKEEMIANLQKYGLIDSDINRILNGEISLDDLMQEIIVDSNRERYRKILETQYLQGYYYSASDSQTRLDILNTEKSGLESRLSEINSTLSEHQSMYSKRQIPTDGVFDQDLYSEKRAIEERTKELNREIVAITQLVNGYGEVDINFNNIFELESAIDECNNEIKILLKQKEEVDIQQYEKEALNGLYNLLKYGLKYSEPFEEVMESTVGCICIDSNGYEYFVSGYNQVDANGNEIFVPYNGDLMQYESIEYCSYADLYGDSVATKKLKELYQL